MHQERGHAQLPDTLQDLTPRLKRYQKGLPEWLIHQLCQYQQIRQANWRPSRLKGAIINFWRSHTQLWRWLFANYPGEIESVGDIQRRHLHAFIDDELEAGYGVKTINLDIRAFQATLRFLQEREYEVPQALLRQAGLREPADLPRFLTDEQIARLQAAIEQRVTTVNTPARQRNALLDRAMFYLLWQAGLRGAELMDLELKDLSLTNQQLTVRGGKGLKDRTLYLTERICATLQAYLAQRSTGTTDHLYSLPTQTAGRCVCAQPDEGSGETSQCQSNAPHAQTHLCHAVGQCGLSHHHHPGSHGTQTAEYDAHLRPDSQ